MAAGVIFMQWDSYVGGTKGPAFFAEEPITFNTRQERLHHLAPGDRLWLASRCPDDGQYYFVATLQIGQLTRNSPGSDKAKLFGEYAVVAERSQSYDLGRRFPAEALLRAFVFDPARPIKYGASIGQSLQTLRLLDASDERVLNAALDAILMGDGAPHTQRHVQRRGQGVDEGAGREDARPGAAARPAPGPLRRSGPRSPAGCCRAAGCD